MHIFIIAAENMFSTSKKNLIVRVQTTATESQSTIVTGSESELTTFWTALIIFHCVHILPRTHIRAEQGKVELSNWKSIKFQFYVQ